MRSSASAVAWTAAILTAALGATILFDAEAGINWPIWVAAASVSLVLSRLVAVGRVETPLLVLVAWATVLSLGFALTDHEPFRPLIVASDAMLLGLATITLGAEKWSDLSAKLLVAVPFLAPFRVVTTSAREVADAPNSVSSPRSRSIIKGALLSIPLVIVLVALLGNADPVIRWSTDRIAAWLPTGRFHPRSVLPVLAYAHPWRKLDRSPPARREVSAISATRYLAHDWPHRAAHGAVERSGGALALRPATSLVLDSSAAGRRRHRRHVSQTFAPTRLRRAFFRRHSRRRDHIGPGVHASSRSHGARAHASTSARAGAAHRARDSPHIRFSPGDSVRAGLWLNTTARVFAQAYMIAMGLSLAALALEITRERISIAFGGASPRSPWGSLPSWSSGISRRGSSTRTSIAPSPPESSTPAT